MASPLEHEINDNGAPDDESHEYPGGESGGHDPWGGQPTVGPQEHGPVSPSHGAAGGHAIDFPWRGNPAPAQAKIGMTTDHPELGQSRKVSGTVKIAQK